MAYQRLQCYLWTSYPSYSAWCRLTGERGRPPSPRLLLALGSAESGRDVSLGVRITVVAACTTADLVNRALRYLCAVTCHVGTLPPPRNRCQIKAISRDWSAWLVPQVILRRPSAKRALCRIHQRPYSYAYSLSFGVHKVSPAKDMGMCSGKHRRLFRWRCRKHGALSRLAAQMRRRYSLGCQMGEPT